MEDFTALGDVKPINLRDIFGTVRLRRLAMHLSKITDPVNLTLPCFSSITHLDIFDEILAEHESTWADLAALPCLTHLCFHAVVPANVWKMVVRTCPDIQLLVNRWSSLRASVARHVAKNVATWISGRTVLEAVRIFGSGALVLWFRNAKGKFQRLHF
ncbi:Zn(2)-C6 fungal-type domain-containing protein [Mycena venus]|uniref:Zn(2)-C6 fungal-type domain-containing protein n=1 Tax=Mycena venus TaxID=2733690 RepID=A0A8H6YY87_9AGAR|nr:Zn(2)-C6 fungal-type domain-containing protein [Mycena venus]